MRLDHLLSKEEEVGVELLFKCRGSLKGRGSKRGWKAGERADKAKSMEKDYGAGLEPESGERHLEKIPVAMRLGETPVLIPNTKVKT